MTLELRDIHKHFGDVRANDGISLTIEAGTLHALLGENGAGKSTLVKVLSGFFAADSGEVVLDGKHLKLRSPRDAIEAGIGILHQEPLVFLPFTVLDNFLVGAPGGVVADRAATRAALARQCAELGFDLRPDALASSLTVGERQQLEIARLVELGARVLIFDEPTTAISTSQRELLFSTLRTLASRGLSVIFVSHKLEEVGELCSSATVLRYGRVAGEVDLPAFTSTLVELMFGRQLSVAERPLSLAAEPRLSLIDLSASERSSSIEGVSLDLRAGEVIGLAGLEGSGQRTLLRACAGEIAPSRGRVLLEGESIAGIGFRASRARGVEYLPADRLGEGLVEGVTIAEHMVLAGRIEGFVIDSAAAVAEAERLIERFSIQGRASDRPEALSGGNQQRLLLALMPEQVELMLMEHPTRGLDVESARWVWEQLLERRTSGTAILFASSDLDELLRYCDRILVIVSGEVFAEVAAEGLGSDELGALIGGQRL